MTFSQRLDWFLLSNDGFLDSIIAEICLDIDNTRTSYRRINNEIKKKERQACDIIINALYQGYFSIPETWISIPLRRATYTNKDISYRSIKKIYDYLKKNKFIKVKLGSEYAKKYTRIFPTKKLQTKFKSLSFKWRHYHYDNNYKSIILRDKNKVDQNIPKNSTIEKYRANLNKINKFLLKHCVALDLDDNALKIIKRLKLKDKNKEEGFEYSLNYSKVYLSRIFSRNSLKLGGRFYRGWWQSLPKKFRPHITIDGHKTSEVDFSTMSLRILYAKENITITDNVDLYDIGLRGSKSYLTESRELIKKYINAILNDDTGNYRLNSKQLTTIKLTHNQLKDRVYKFHKPISKYFSTGIGLETMFIDSQIAEKIMLHYLEDDIVVLPVHDSFIIRSGFESDLSRTMINKFKEVVGFSTKVKAIGPLLPEHFYKYPKIKTPNTNTSEGIVSGKDLWNLLNNKSSNIYNNYLDSWNKWNYKFNFKL
jgi:hypothetical protein